MWQNWDLNPNLPDTNAGALGCWSFVIKTVTLIHFLCIPAHLERRQRLSDLFRHSALRRALRRRSMFPTGNVGNAGLREVAGLQGTVLWCECGELTNTPGFLEQCLAALLTQKHSPRT